MTTKHGTTKLIDALPQFKVIATTGMILILLGCPVGIWAMDDTDEGTHTMDPVVVSATRSPISKRKVATNITVITSDQLEQMPATSVAQVLEYVPGVSIQFNGGPGSDGGTVSIQGSNTRHVAIYQDGVPLNQLVNPRKDLSYLPLDAVEQIEIYKGAASSAWGSALGGVINIVTKEPDVHKPLAANAQTSYGTHATLKARANISGAKDKLSWLLSYTHEQNDGFIEHTDYELDGVYAKLNYNLNETDRLNLACAYNQGQNADPILNWEDFGTEPFWDDIRRKHSYQRLLFETAPTTDMILTLEGRHRQSESTIEDVYPDRRESFLDYREELWGASVRLDWQTSTADTFIAGIDGDWGRFEWDPFVDARQTDTTGNWALYANDTHTRGAFTVNASARVERNQDYGSAFSPSLGAVYRFTRLGALVRAQVAKGFSAPDFAWVHSPSFGNPNLEPEDVINYQLGGEIHPLKWLQMELNFFRADVDNLIVFDTTPHLPDRPFGRYLNIEKTTRQGLEWSLTARFDSGLTLHAGGSHTDVRDDNTDEVIEDIPSTLYNLSLAYARGGISNSLLGKYIDNNSSHDETQDKVFLFDWLLKFKLPTTDNKGNWTLYGAVYNLFDTDYLYRTVWPQPGRWGEVGIRYEF